MLDDVVDMFIGIMAAVAYTLGSTEPPLVHEESLRVLNTLLNVLTPKRLEEKDPRWTMYLQ